MASALAAAPPAEGALPVTDLYTIESAALPQGLRVAGFRGTEGLSELYRFHVGLLAAEDQEIDLAAARGGKVTLRLHPAPDQAVAVHGMIASLALKHCWQGQALYELVIVPLVWGMTLTHMSRVFVDMSIPEIAKQLLGESGIGADRYELRLYRDYPKRLHVCQYRESRWSFIARLLEREGIYYFFEQTDEHEKLVITDHRSFHAALRREPVRYVPLSGSDDAISVEALRSLTCEQHSLPQEVRVRDYDDLKPAQPVFADAPVCDAGRGKIKSYGDGVLTVAEAEALAATRAEEWLAEELVYRGGGRVFLLRPGYRFSVEEHPLASMNRELLAAQVRHHGCQAAQSPLVRDLLGLVHADDYRAEVTAIAADTQFRPRRQTPVPRIYGLERGFIDGPAESEYAQIDEHGRYKVKLHFDFDDSDKRDGAASTWIRMLQPHSGSPEGFHFPLRRNTEVLVAFLGGDPDRPVIVGAVPNAVQPSPVTSENHTQNVIQTGGLNRIEIEDQESKQYVDISTPPQDTRIHLGEPHGAHSHYIVLHTDGNHLEDIGGNQDIEVGGPRSDHVKGAVTEKYDTSQTTTVSGPRVDTVTRGVKEDYTGFYDTFVKGNRLETVTGWVGESYASLRTTVTGAVTEEFGAQTTTIKGGRVLSVGGQLTETAGAVNQGYDSQTTVVKGAWTGTYASWDMHITGGATITTPSWKVTNPNETWFGACFDANWAKKCDVVGFKSGIYGLAVDAKGIGVAVTGFSRSLTGSARAAAGTKLDINGIQAGVAGVYLKTVGLYTID
ncbi:MAG: type VI secretion system tip protein VgrG [Deltaproteobacteria bacterium]|nr:type VI secretion system tip protein VgrG [Deltaproteobacteria bacterium]